MMRHDPHSGKQSSADRFSAMSEFTKTGKRLNAASKDFLRADVETALTFAEIALGTEDAEKRQRNKQHAKDAYDTILRFQERVTYTPAENAYMTERMERLKKDLEQLGESF